MSDYKDDLGMEENVEESARDNIVKLQINGAPRVVNTIEDNKTDKGVSLVCPFPSLEVNIPIRFTGANGEECEGCIRRIGVEDDPETGLPKLRLSVLKGNGEQETVMTAPSNTLLAKVSEQVEVPKSLLESFEEDGVDIDVDLASRTDITVDMAMRARTTSDSLESPVFAESDDSEFDDDHTTTTTMNGLFDDLPDTNTAELLSLEDIDSAVGHRTHDRDPEWACYADMPIPGGMKERAQTRRRRRAIAVAAWMMVAGIAAGGVFVLGKAGVVDVSNMKSYVSAFKEEPVAEVDSLAQLSEDETMGAAETENVASLADRPDIVQASAVASRPAAEVTGESLSQASAVDENPSVNGSDGAEQTAEEAVSEMDDIESESAEDSGETEDSLTTEVVLPTRWPAEFATAYRLQNPNGVVVDVPGGLVKREGWLTMKEGDKIIRSIKAVQRENGARFIVYVKGNLPKFRTSPRSGGIRLSLYYEGDGNSSSETQQVAMLDE